MTLNATNYSISKSLFEKIANAFKSAVRFIHRKGGYKAEYLADDNIKPLIESTYEAFSEAVDFGVKDNVIPEAMKMYLKNNTFVFSGFKTHQQLDRVSRLLHDDDGHVKPFNRFLQDVKSIDKKYNRTYLQAEYNFAVASAQSAGKWHEFSEYADRYYLQYRTAKDERVREEHAILDGITLPFDDKFWDEFFPPNGWNCRCEAIQVSKKRYEPSNSSEALARGRAATYKPNADGVNKAAIFRFNPGKEQRIFPKKHPYFPKGCGDCELNQYAIGKNRSFCIACKFLTDDCISNARKEIVNVVRKIKHTTFKHPAFNGSEAVISRKFERELVNKSKRNIESLIEKIDILENIEQYLDTSIKLNISDVEHNDKENGKNMYSLTIPYKGNLNHLKGKMVTILFKEFTSDYIVFYLIKPVK